MAKTGNSLPGAGNKSETVLTAADNLSVKSLEDRSHVGSVSSSGSGSTGTITSSNSAVTVESIDSAGNKESGQIDDSFKVDYEENRREAVASAVARLNDYVQKVQRDLEFSVDEQAGVYVVKVIDRSSREVVRQIPSEEALELARKLNDQEPLRLFSAQV
ncbi:MAG: flagellar protein FlaG [Proteobacteria bacterium]|nr:flagellar protein FlaG [Pseudomonadota bacterium]